MKNIQLLLVIFLLVVSNVALSQKKILDHTVYNDWKRVANEKVSRSGNFTTFEVLPHQGDGVLTIYNLQTERRDTFVRATNAEFSYHESFIIFTIKPGFDTLRKLELAKVDKKKWPKDTLAVFYFNRDTLIKIPNVLSHSLAEKEDVLAYITDDNEIKTEAEEIPWWKFWKRISFRKSETKEIKSDGHHFYVLNDKGETVKEFLNVTSFLLDETATNIVLVRQEKITVDKKEKDSVWLHNYKFSGRSDTLSIVSNEIKSLNFSHGNDKLAFLTSTDTNKIKQFELALWDLNSGSFKIVADTNTQSWPAQKSVSEFRKPEFSADGNILFFGISDKPVQEPKDTLVDAEKVKLDIWNWKEDRLQPQQLLELSRDKRQNHLYAYHLNEDRFVQLSNDSLKVRLNIYDDANPEYLHAINEKPYSHTYNWAMPYLTDHYRISLETGEAELIMKEVGFGGELSPSGNKYVFFNREDLNQYFIDLEKKDTTCITCQEPTVIWLSDNNGMPFEPAPMGIVGWTKGESAVIVESENDLWNFDFATKKITSLTGRIGLDQRIKMQLQNIDRDSAYIDLSETLIVGMDRKSKDRIIYTNENGVFKSKMRTPHEILSIHKNKERDIISYRKMSLKDYPDLYVNNLNFDAEKRLSNANPQQDEYNWASVELVKWISYDSIPLEGLLYKPEDFDTSKSYPLLVYFYELYSDELHNHYAPRPTASIIFPTEYASAGYMVFIPDIRYREGHPAQSAYDCIMSGTDHVLAKYPNVDSTRMGLQGQSWGGYQAAQLITMTTRYKAAMAGAPVANMFSAYGGMRWGSGLNRAFQYEKTQSRIGKTIWEAPELYRENSPLFFLPNVQTPLLIMHNDGDGAVPWYQGLELFNGLKRLGKPVWLLNYNGDDHNLMKNANRMDLSIRMRQFFDFYLMGKEEPIWMSKGIPAVEKGKVTGYEFE